MPFIAHAVLRDTTIEHLATLDFEPPCNPGPRSPGRDGHWTWTVDFRDVASSGAADVMVIAAEHLATPHAGEPPGDSLGPVTHSQLALRLTRSPVLLRSAHGEHEDRLLTYVKHLSSRGPRIRLYISLLHTQPGAPIEIPKFMGAGLSAQDVKAFAAPGAA